MQPIECPNCGSGEITAADVAIALRETNGFINCLHCGTLLQATAADAVNTVAIGHSVDPRCIQVDDLAALRKLLFQGTEEGHVVLLCQFLLDKMQQSSTQWMCDHSYSVRYDSLRGGSHEMKILYLLDFFRRRNLLDWLRNQLIEYFS
jgi:transcription elongation factor Elf1